MRSPRPRAEWTLRSARERYSDSMSLDLAAEFEIVVRLVVAAVLGALIGLEREIHEHPAGMRTHLLVALGSAGFTVLSISAFQAPGADPARIAAQIVAGVGFLGAGAILKEGATIRGLTTAASLWAVAAVGMAAGAGAWVPAVAVSVIVLFSLWPLRVVADRFVGRGQRRLRIAVTVDRPRTLVRLVELVEQHGATIAYLATERRVDDAMSVDLEVRTQDPGLSARLTAAITALDGVEIRDSTLLGE